MAGPAAVGIELTDDERAELTRWTRRRKTSQALATRARIVLAAADGMNNAEICRKLGVCRPTVRSCAESWSCSDVPVLNVKG